MQTKRTSWPIKRGSIKFIITKKGQGMPLVKSINGGGKIYYHIKIKQPYSDSLVKSMSIGPCMSARALPPRASLPKVKCTLSHPTIHSNANSISRPSGATSHYSSVAPM